MYCVLHSAYFFIVSFYAIFLSRPLATFSVVLFVPRIAPTHTHTHTHTHTQGYGYQAAMAGFYLGTMLSSRFTNSGAFEVAFDGALLFSRLATGAFPVPADIAGLVKEGLAAGGHA